MENCIYTRLFLLLILKRKVSSDIRKEYCYFGIVQYYYLFFLIFISLHSIYYLHVFYFTEYIEIVQYAMHIYITFP